jgi:hypothetical protein
MFGLLNRMFGISPTRPSLDAVGFDTTGYELAGVLVPGHLRVWNTPEGDQLGVHFFGVPPDLPAAASVDELADFYRRLIAGCPGSKVARLVETTVVAAGGCPAIRLIVSVPQEPFGRACVGSLTVPFRDLSFVLKCQVRERGLTGVKEALLLHRRWSAEESPRPLTEGPPWDPDAPEHDVEFPRHPVARARRILDHVQATLTLAEPVRRLPGFPLPI